MVSPALCCRFRQCEGSFIVLSLLFTELCLQIVKALRDAGADYTLRTVNDHKTARDYAEGKDPELLELLPANVEEEL